MYQNRRNGQGLQAQPIKHFHYRTAKFMVSISPMFASKHCHQLPSKSSLHQYLSPTIHRKHLETSVQNSNHNTIIILLILVGKNGTHEGVEQTMTWQPATKAHKESQCNAWWINEHSCPNSSGNGTDHGTSLLGKSLLNLKPLETSTSEYHQFFMAYPVLGYQLTVNSVQCIYCLPTIIPQQGLNRLIGATNCCIL